MTERVWVRDDLSNVVEASAAVIWIVMDHACVYFKADGTMGAIQGKPHRHLAGEFSTLWARIL